MADEARAMLDALMGGDRNAPIPKGASLSKKHGSSHHTYSNNQFRKRSCYDPDVCPLYCIWGIDLYELFVNTKSDIGANPYIVDEDARNEYMKLPPQEKDRLGYEHVLFRKLQELVKSCDRTVSKNKEKLRIEIQKKSGKGGTVQDLVMMVDNDQVERVAEMQVKVEELEADIKRLVKQLDEVEEKERLCVLEEIEKMAKEKSVKELEEEEKKDPEQTQNDSSEAVDAITTSSNNNSSSDIQNEKKVGEGTSQTTLVSNLPTPHEFDTASKLHNYSSLILSKIYEITPLQEQINSQKRQLFFYRSDTSSDKTVCEVSGNFMSSRDADERIAAHYAGKQYVGWKIVREKYKELQKKFGRGAGPAMSMGHRPGHLDWGPSPYSGPPPPHYGVHNDRDRYGGNRIGRDRDRPRTWERERSRDYDKESRRDRERDRKRDRDRHRRDGRSGRDGSSSRGYYDSGGGREHDRHGRDYRSGRDRR